jgi:hypothetical protein
MLLEYYVILGCNAVQFGEISFEYVASVFMVEQ